MNTNKFPRFGLSIAVLIFSILPLVAQNNVDAERITNQLLASFRSSAVRTNFSLSVVQKNAVNSQSVSGNFVMKAEKFMLDMGETKAWFDGKTQWTYMVADKEVSITEPTVDELASINPMAIIAGFKAKSKIVFSKQKSSQNHLIELLPKSKNEEFAKVEIQINKTTGNLVSVKITDKKGVKSILSLTNYQKGFKANDDYFVFNKAKYKGIMINDLR
ncbi:MAG: outer membrane lipoprotein carrier protein LolA [Paludibacter sp.]|nr:outer membrane lipoprotein carrier protein LolA [Paludibacter sp.]